ncbi:MAG TPA: hypothetical protein VIR77_01495 [Pontiella sp.]
MESLQSIIESLRAMAPMTWLIMLAAAFICLFVLFNKAVKLMLKLAVIVIMALLVAYFLRQAGIL